MKKLLLLSLIFMFGNAQAVDISNIGGGSAASVSSGSIVSSSGNSSISSVQSISNINGQVIRNTNIITGTPGAQGIGFTGANGQVFSIKSFPLQQVR